MALLSVCLFTVVACSSASGETIFETEPATTDICSCGATADSAFYFASNFQVTDTVETGSIGGQFRDFGDGSPIFGAIVRVDGETDRIGLANFESDKLLGATIIDVPPTTQEVSGNLRVTLTPGWYAVVFGSGRYGTTGAAGAVANNVTQGTSEIYSLNTNTNGISISATALRFFVESTPVPEFSVLLDTKTSEFFDLGVPELHDGAIVFKTDNGISQMELADPTPQQVADDFDTTIPETNSTFSYFEDSATTRDRSVAFFGGIFNSLAGLYTDARGTLERVIDDTMTVPGGTDPFLFPQHFRRASISRGAITFAGRNGTPSMGIYR